MPAKRLDILAKEEEICNKYRTGSYSTNQLAKEYNCSKGLVLNIVQRHGVKLDKNITSKLLSRSRSGANNYKFRNDVHEKSKEIFKKYNEGTPAAELAIEYKCSKSTMDRLIRKAKAQKFGRSNDPPKSNATNKKLRFYNKMQLVDEFLNGREKLSDIDIAQRTGTLVGFVSRQRSFLDSMRYVRSL